MENLVALTNLYQSPIDNKVLSFYRNIKNQNRGKNPFKIIEQRMEDENLSFKELVNTLEYEKV